MIHNYKAPPVSLWTKLKLYWPTISLALDGVLYLTVGINVFICLFRHEYNEAVAWGVLYMMCQLRDIKEKL